MPTLSSSPGARCRRKIRTRLDALTRPVRRVSCNTPLPATPSQTKALHDSDRFVATTGAWSPQETQESNKMAPTAVTGGITLVLLRAVQPTSAPFPHDITALATCTTPKRQTRFGLRQSFAERFKDLSFGDRSEIIELRRRQTPGTHKRLMTTPDDIPIFSHQPTGFGCGAALWDLLGRSRR